jgi:four helix bundle protein
MAVFFLSLFFNCLVRVYRFAAALPRGEQYTLGTEIRRLAIRTRTSVVDGAACEAAADCSRAMEAAYRSLRDISTCVEFAVDLALAKAELVADLLETGDRMAGAVFAYRRSLL